MPRHRSESRRTRRSNVIRFGLPLAIMEIFSIPLILIVMSDPKFDRHEWEPPVFEVVEVEHLDSGSRSEVSPYVLALSADGGLDCDGTPATAETFINEIENSIKPDQNIHLLVQTADDGTGNVSSFLDVQANLSKTDLWTRTRIIHKSPQNQSTGPQAEERSETL